MNIHTSNNKIGIDWEYILRDKLVWCYTAKKKRVGVCVYVCEIIKARLPHVQGKKSSEKAAKTTRNGRIANDRTERERSFPINLSPTSSASTTTTQHDELVTSLLTTTRATALF